MQKQQQSGDNRAPVRTVRKVQNGLASKSRDEGGTVIRSGKGGKVERWRRGQARPTAHVDAPEPSNILLSPPVYRTAPGGSTVRFNMALINPDFQVCTPYVAVCLPYRYPVFSSRYKWSRPSLHKVHTVLSQTLRAFVSGGRLDYRQGIIRSEPSLATSVTFLILGN